MELKQKTGLLQTELKEILSVFGSHNRISKVILFGSRAKGTHSNGSDIDLAIKGNNLTINDILDISIELDDLSLPYKFDLIIYDRITEPALKEHIDSVGIHLA